MRSLLSEPFRRCPADWWAEWEPYRAACEPDGFTLWHNEGLGRDAALCRLPVDRVPYEAYEFASAFDDWFRFEPLGEAPDGDGPLECAGPFAFTLELPLEGVR
jgi:hypothetical protein